MSDQEITALYEGYKYKFPLMICVSPDYRDCFNGITVEQCVSQIKEYRDDCNKKVTPTNFETVNTNYGEYTQCMLKKHAKVKTIEGLREHCIGTVSVDMDKSNFEIKKLEDEKIRKLLE